MPRIAHLRSACAALLLSGCAGGYASDLGGGAVYPAPAYGTPVYSAPAYPTPVYSGPVYSAPVYRTPGYPVPVHREERRRRFDIPPGHLPPPGACRVWFPDRPPGHQPPPTSCNVRVPPGAVLVEG